MKLEESVMILWLTVIVGWPKVMANPKSRPAETPVGAQTGDSVCTAMRRMHFTIIKNLGAKEDKLWPHKWPTGTCLMATSS